MQKGLVSIIIPVFNTERYLRRCVASVLNQTYRELDIILVDDGSTDACPDICDEFALNDHRVRVIHKENGGQSSARNLALNSGLLGEYATFVDSDDWIDNNTVEYCLSLAENYKVDAVQIQMLETDNESVTIDCQEETLEVFKGDEVLQKFMDFSTRTSNYGLCGCFMKAELLKNLRFREGKVYEDIDYKYKMLRNTQSMIYSNLRKYYYFQSGDSTSMGGLKRRDFELYDAAEELYNLTKNNPYGSIKFLGEVKRARTAFSLLSKMAYYGMSDMTLDKKEVLKTLTKEHRRNLAILLKSPMRLSRKVLAVAFAVDYYFAESMIKVIKRFLVY